MAVKKHPLYITWHGMKQRCYNKNANGYQRYGGRGIAVCDTWRLDFHQFVADMGPRPPKCSLDRIDNSLGYSKDNCRWATHKEQSRNMRNNVKLSCGTLVCDLAAAVGVPPDTIARRVRRGVPLSRALDPTPIHSNVGGLAGNAAQKAKTHCPRGHAYTIENTRITPKGGRCCRECGKADTARSNEKQRLARIAKKKLMLTAPE